MNGKTTLGFVGAMVALVLAVGGCSSPSTNCGPGETSEPLLPDGTQDLAGDAASPDVLLPDTSTDFQWPDVVPEFVPQGCEAAPYGFGCPCGTNGECVGGYCVESTDGFVCTEECFEECPAGWGCKGLAGFGSDMVFLCVPVAKKLCFPCKKHEQCAGGRCVALDDASYCALNCDGQNPCPDGFDCAEKVIDGTPETVCVPASGSCDCLKDHEGALKPCQETNLFGTCYGYAECDPTSGWSACSAPTPAAEECNGLDDDCDGQIDEDVPESEPCTAENENGVCTGTATCLGPLGYVCQAQEPASEACDYMDNDCDNLVDEGFVDGEGKYSDYFHCGSCSITCASGFPNAKAKCDASKAVPKCIVDSCDPGYYKLNDYQCIPNTASLCEPCTTNENCLFEGAQCVTLSDGKFCAKPCEGDTDCPAGYACKTSGESLQCLPVTGSCTCTGDNLDLSKSCSSTWPPQPLPDEPSITCYGFQFCTQSGWTECQLPDEECDDSDNDCNGIVDDPFVDGQGKYFTDENCGQCGNNCLALSFSNAAGVCDKNKAIPDCKMQCKAGYSDVNLNPNDGCECLFVSNQDTPDGIDQNCDGVDGEVTGGVFVAKNGKDTNPGTIELPALTLGAAIGKAEASGKRDVYVATGVYVESVTLKQGVNLYGGYSADFKVRHILLYETVIMGLAPTQEKPGAVTVGNVSSKATTFDGFTVFGYDNEDPSEGSYGIYIRDSGDKLAVRNCHVYAGSGGDGQKGTDGQDGLDGQDGANGIKAYLYSSYLCNAGGAISNGAAGGSQTCTGVAVAGGKGGSSYCPLSNSAPKAGEPGTGGSGPGAGTGGGAGWDAQFSTDCGLCNVPSETNPMDGAMGGHGKDGTYGSAGQGCKAAGGSVTGGLWVPTSGGNGQGGGHGGGGGGGGAGAGVDSLLFSCTDQVGGTGGGGGSGACAGTAGTGGSGGGGSFGIFLYYSVAPASVPVIESNWVQGASGGSGGTGGNGGTGGIGGAGGAGGTEFSSAWCARAGGGGGNGGHGGHGGGGGGGCGGVSYCVYASGQGGVSLANIKTKNQCVPGAGGPGGSGGPSIGNPGQTGQVGTQGDFNF